MWWTTKVWTQKSRRLFEYLSFWPQGHVIGGELVCLSKSASFRFTYKLKSDVIKSHQQTGWIGNNQIVKLYLFHIYS